MKQRDPPASLRRGKSNRCSGREENGEMGSHPERLGVIRPHRSPSEPEGTSKKRRSTY